MTGLAAANGHDTGLRRRKTSASLSDGEPAKAQRADKSRHVGARWELPRKVLHGSVGGLEGFVTLGLYFLRPPQMSIIILPLCGALVIVSMADAVRLRNIAFERLYERLLGSLMRESEKSSVNGVVWYLVGVIFVLSFYPRDVAVEAILLLSWADTAASTFGRMFGHLTPRLPSRILGLPVAHQKSLAGALGSFGMGALTTLAFWGFCGDGMGIDEAIWQWGQPRTGGWLGISLLSIGAGAATSFTELLDICSLDDNLTLPIISGALVWAIASSLEVLSHI